MEFDDILTHHVGEFGLYQRLLVGIFSLVNIFECFQAMGTVFIAEIPNHWCETEVYQYSDCTKDQQLDFSIPYIGDTRDKCNKYDHNYTYITQDDVCGNVTLNLNHTSMSSCLHWSFDNSTFTSTIATKWNLYCSKEVWVYFGTASYHIGRIVGCLIMGYFVDRFGRRRMILLLQFVGVTCGTLCALVPNYWAFTGLRFIQAVFNTAKAQALFVAIMELVGPSWRIFCGCYVMIMWAVGYALLAVIAYFVRDWQILQISITAPEYIFFILGVMFLPESPRWLLTKNREKEAIQVLNKMSETNKKSSISQNVDIKVKEDAAPASIIDLIRTPALRMLSLNLFFNWFANGFVYYGLSLNTSNLAGNVYINTLLFGAIEIPAYIFLWFCFTKFGRVIPYSACLILGGASLLATIPIPESLTIIAVVLAMFGKFFITATFTMAWLYTTEVYPTEIRATGLNTASMFARVASVLASFVGMLSATHRAIPLLIFGGASILAGASTLAMPETRGAVLTQTVEDGEEFVRRYSCFAKHKHEIVLQEMEPVVTVAKDIKMDNGDATHL